MISRVAQRSREIAVTEYSKAAISPLAARGLNDMFLFQIPICGQGPLPMRYGSAGNFVSTGRPSKRGWAGIGSVRQIGVWRADLHCTLAPRIYEGGARRARGVPHLDAEKFQFRSNLPRFFAETTSGLGRLLSPQCAHWGTPNYGAIATGNRLL